MMIIDYAPYYKKYEEIVEKADAAFQKVSSEYSDCIKCEEKCSDCCHALFDLSLIEAMYINHHFNEKFDGSARHSLIENANKADRKTYKIKKRAYEEYQKDKDEATIFGILSMERVRCPLLNGKELCDLYDHRPITCRLYGMPTSTAGMSHTCGKSGFEQGKQYPSANFDVIFNQLYTISAEMIKDIKSKNVKMADMLIPLSMALITDYNDEYMGMDRKACEVSGQVKVKEGE